MIDIAVLDEIQRKGEFVRKYADYYSFFLFEKKLSKTPIIDFLPFCWSIECFVPFFITSASHLQDSDMKVLQEEKWVFKMQKLREHCTHKLQKHYIKEVTKVIVPREQKI